MESPLKQNESIGLRGFIERAFFFFSKSENRWLWFFAFFVLIVSSILQLENDNYRGEMATPENGHRAIQLVGDRDEFVEIVKTWVKNPYSGELGDSIEQYRNYLISFDYLYPVWYALLGMLAVARVYYSPGKKPSWWQLIGFSLPLIAALFDYAENSLHLWFLRDAKTINSLERIDPVLVNSAAWFAKSKLLLLCTTIGIVLLGLILGYGGKGSRNNSSN
jgi:hypothetical protein